MYLPPGDRWSPKMPELGAASSAGETNYLPPALANASSNGLSNRPPALATQWHLSLYTAGRPYLDFIHAERIALQQPPDHFRSGHGLGFRAATGDYLLGQGLDSGFYPCEFDGLAQRVAFLPGFENATVIPMARTRNTIAAFYRRVLAEEMYEASPNKLYNIDRTVGRLH